MESYEAPDYPAIRFLIRFGKIFAGVLGALPLIAGIAAALAGLSPWLLLAGLVISPILFLIALSYVEMARIIADTLMPR
jgi:hypothetical protein